MTTAISASGLKGVTYQENRPQNPWKASIHHRGVRMNLGYFATKEEAAAAYNKKAVLLFGLTTYLNPIPRP